MTAADWTATTDKLPDEGQLVYFVLHGVVYEGSFEKGMTFQFRSTDRMYKAGAIGVTHWQPRHIPAAPQKPQADAFETWYEDQPIPATSFNPKTVAQCAWNCSATRERERFAAGVEKILKAWPDTLYTYMNLVNDLRALAAGKDGGV